MAARSRGRRSALAGKALFGILIIILGMLFLLNSAGFAELDDTLKWWPSLIILYGLWRLIASGFRSRFLPILLIVVGVFLQMGQLGLDIDFSTYWPIVFIAFGIAILLGRLRFDGRRNNGRNHGHSGSAPTIIDGDASAPSDSEDYTLHTVAGSQNRVISGDFEGGSVNLVMGNGNLDMRDAIIVNAPATLEVSIVMGDVKVRAPAEWSVQIANSVTMGDVKDIRHIRSENKDTPDLIISGKVTMGSLQITD